MKRLNLLFLLLASPLCGLNPYCPTPPSHTTLSWCGTIEIEAAALYWKPCTHPFTYGQLNPPAAPADQVTENQELQANFSYTWGGSVTLRAYAPCLCVSPAVRWVYLDSTRNSFAFPPTNGFQVISFFGGGNNAATFIKPRLSLIHSRLSFSAYYPFYTGCGRNAYCYGGWRYLLIKESRSTVAVNILSPGNGFYILTNERAQYSGNGVEFGVGGDYSLTPCLRLCGSFGGVVAVGPRKSNFIRSQISPPDNLQLVITTLDQRTTRCVAGLDTKIGIACTSSWACVGIAAEFGYEMNAYFNPYGLRKPNIGLPNNPEQDSFDVNVFFGGPYFSISLRY